MIYQCTCHRTMMNTTQLCCEDGCNDIVDPACPADICDDHFRELYDATRDGESKDCCNMKDGTCLSIGATSENFIDRVIGKGVRAFQISSADKPYVFPMCGRCRAGRASAKKAASLKSCKSQTTKCDDVQDSKKRKIVDDNLDDKQKRERAIFEQFAHKRHKLEQERLAVTQLKHDLGEMTKLGDSKHLITAFGILSPDQCKILEANYATKLARHKTELATYERNCQLIATECKTKLKELERMM